MAAELTDARAREQILSDLDRNLLVQAGAGAGKTHALIGRMVEMVRTGRETVDHMAAITFTKKAAGEMRARFHQALREAISKTEPADPARTRLQDAVDQVDQCYIGTIHAFCARLLRERPLEAGLPPDFRELDERGEWVSLRNAWDRFVLDRYAEKDERLDRFDTWGIRTDDFFDFFLRRSQFTDLDLHWTEVPPADLIEPARIASEWVESVFPWIPDPLVEKPDRLQDALFRASSFLRNRGIEGERDARYLLSLLDLGSSSVTLKRWAPNQSQAKDIRDNGLPEMVETIVRPALTRWRRAIYPEVAAFIDEAVEAHRELRFDNGSVTFQDLLEQAASLLVNNRSLRQQFQDRYRRLFVDEFQDTDPLQAEILLYLTADDPEVSDWRDCRPRPGSLFLVGDEKQAIYRFRRADLDVFRYVRDRVRASGGDVVDLNTSFRSLSSICSWINDAFDPIFGAFDPRYQASFTPLSPYRTDDSLPNHVLCASIPKIPQNDRNRIAAQDASRIARFIGASLNGDESVADCALSGSVAPGDFMILTRTTGHLDSYARALEHLGIPFSIEGSGKLRDSPDLHDLVRVMEVIATPEDPIPLIAHLRGRLVGLGDDELYAVRQADGAFDYRIDCPDGLPEETAGRLERAIDQLRSAARWLQTEPASVAVERILDLYGILPFSALQPMGSSRAGNLLRLLSIVRRWEIAGWNWTECLIELQDLRDDPEYKIEEMTLDAGSGTSVRLMNLHQAKGLQARVVFLADPYDTSYVKHDPDFHVSRSGSEPRLTLPVYRTKGQHGRELISEPHGWDQDAEEEQRFLDAEERRLVYVAATRAEDLLVVSRYEGNLDRGPWHELNPFLENVPELPHAKCEPPVSVVSEAPDFDRIDREIQERWTRSLRSTYTTTSVTAEDGARIAAQETEDEILGRGTDYGQLVHDLFEQAIEGRLPEDIERYVAVRVEKEEQTAENVGHALEALHRLRSSDMWKEMEASPQVSTEVDFARCDTLLGQSEIVRGRIDLVYRVVGGWKIVDFKTDRARSDADVEILKSQYGDQVRAYIRYWSELSGERVKSAGLWSTDPGLWIPVV